MFRIFLISMILLSVAPASAHAFDVQASVDSTSISKNETVRLTITVTGGSADIDTSPITDFKVVSGGTSTSVRIINMEIAREAVYSFTLFPKKEGRLTIPPLKMSADGKIYSTQEITIQVSQKPKEKGALAPVFVRSEISEPSPFEGQQIIYSFKVFHSVQIANARFDAPAFEEFAAKEIEPQKNYRTVISGKQHSVHEIRYVLTPLKPGIYTLEPAVLRCDLVIKRRGRNTFQFDSFFQSSLFSDLKTKTFQSTEHTVTVRPLPPYTGDHPFTGLIGSFDIQSNLNKNTLTVGDSVTLSVSVSGRGNIMDAALPDMVLPETFKIYQENPEETIQLDENGHFGTKIFRWALVANTEGTFNLEPIRMAYFDVISESYLTVSTLPLKLIARAGKSEEHLEVSASPFSDGGLRLDKKKVEFTGRDILPINESIEALVHRPALSAGMFLLSLLIPVVLYAAARGAAALLHKQENTAVTMARRAHDAIRAAEQTEASEEQRLASLHRALIFAVNSTAGKKGESLTSREVLQLLTETGLPQELAQETIGVLDDIESLRFAGESNRAASTDALISRTRDVVKRLVK